MNSFDHIFCVVWLGFIFRMIADDIVYIVVVAANILSSRV